MICLPVFENACLHERAELNLAAQRPRIFGGLWAFFIEVQMSEIDMTKCPFCGHHKAMERTGINRIQRGQTADRQYTFRYDHVDLDGSAFISVRECGGRGKGFPEVSRITLKETVKSDRYKELRESLLSQCYQVMRILIGEEE